MAGSVGTAILTGGVGQAVGSLVGPAADASKGIYRSLKRKYDYIKNLDVNFKNLNMEARYLSGRQQDVADKVKRNNVLMQKTHECNTWLEDVGKMNQNLEDLKTRYNKTIDGSCGICRFYSHFKLSRDIVKMTKSVVDLKERLNPDNTFLTERNPERVERKFAQKINEFPSLGEHVEMLLEYIKDDSMKKIGIWGMSGVGKTTILQNLNDEVEKLKIFDIVLWVTVSKDGSIGQIQQEILRRLSMNVEESGTERQATLISNSLENKKYLLLLDEVFNDINLRSIGIHDNHLHGKVVLATRERFICNLMETDEEIKVERLSRADARKLFRDVVGEAFDHPRIRPIAERVLKQCGELAHIIRAVGSHLKDKLNEDLWQNTLSKLRYPNKFEVKHMDDVFNVFKVIYEELNDTLKGCLCYGASFPEDHEIYRDYLIECWKADELIGFGDTFKKTREEGHASLEILIDRCLFDGCRGMKYVKMPIIFRNTAVAMAYPHKVELLVRDNEELENFPPIGKWVDAKVISLMDSNLKDLPKRPECSVVSTLFLQKNDKICVIPTSFFDCMLTLRILDVCGTGIKNLPPSISNLINLRSLYLNDCHRLLHLPVEVGQLKKLEVLDIRRSGICGLPDVIGELLCLRCLRLSFTSVENNQNHVEANGVDVIISSSILERLHHLEELTIDPDPKEPRWNKIALTIAKELANLRKLSALSFYFPSIESLEDFTRSNISWKNGTSQAGNNFRSFDICVGSYRTNNAQFDVSKCSSHRYLQYAGGKDTPIVIKEVLNTTCAFELIGHQNITYLSDFGIDEMKCLEVCLVEGCKTMTNIIQSDTTTTPAFPWLRELHLCKLHQLNDICQGSACAGSFSRLTTLTLCDCPNVIKVVSLDMAKQFSELQYLKVESCSQIIEIIGVDTHSDERVAFPKLKTLELVKLDGLASIHSTDLFEWRDLQKMEIIQCDKLTNLCLNTINATKLRSIRCNEDWWGALVLSVEVKSHLQSICCFY